MSYLDFFEFFPPGLVHQVGSVGFQGLKGLCGFQNGEVLDMSGTLKEKIRDEGAAEFALLRNEAQILMNIA